MTKKASTDKDESKPKRAAPAFFAVQQKILKHLKEKHGISHKEAMVKLKQELKTVNGGKEYDKNGNNKGTYSELLNKLAKNNNV